MPREVFEYARKMVEEKRTIPSLFLYVTARFSSPDAFLERVESGFEAVSTAEFRKLVVELSIGLGDAGLEKGDPVALISENRVEWAAVDLAVLCAGGVTVPVSPLASPAQTSFMMRNSGARMAVVSTFELARKLRAESSLSDIPLYCMEGSDRGNIRSLEELALRRRNDDRERDALFSARALTVRKDDLSTIMYTSGTGGMPKGVRLTHANIVSNVLATSKALLVTPQDRCLSFLPLSHALERTAGFLTIFFNGASIAYAESIHTLPRDLSEVRPTILVSVPRLYEKMEKTLRLEAHRGGRPKRWIIEQSLSLAKETGRARAEGRRLRSGRRAAAYLADLLVYRKMRTGLGGNLRFCISGGATLDKELADTLIGCGIPVLEGYGLTEASPICTVNTPERFRTGSVGIPLPGVTIRIANDGEVLVKGENVMAGYQDLEEETRQTLKDGWLHTGDLGRIEDGGFLVLTGRKRELLITSWGVNVSPSPIEQSLKRSPFIRDAMLVGEGRPFLGALIVPDHEAIAKHLHEERSGDARELLKKEIERLCAHLSPAERIREIAVLSGEFSMERGELTTTMKLVRPVIERNYRNEIESIYRR
jgi:long-chain acyl-CoA synthetase